MVRHDPIFGDGVVNVSRPAVEIYENNLKIAYYKNIPDPGHPTLLPYLLATTWKIFGFNLPVTHVFNIIIAFWLLVVFGKVSRDYLSNSVSFWSQFVFAISSVIVSQAAFLSPHLLTFALFFTALHLVNKKKFVLCSLFLSLMVLTHLEALFLWILICLWAILPLSSLFLKLRKSGIWLMILLPSLVFGIWLLYHHHVSGWFITSPDYMRDGVSIKDFIYNILLSGWRLLDNGFIIFWIFVLLNLRSIFRTEAGKVFLFFSIGLVLLLSFSISFGIAHRYYIPIYGLLILGVFAINFSAKKVISGIVFLLAGHFMYLPFNTLGDHTLHYRSFFTMEKELSQIVKQDALCAYTPIAFPRIYTHLQKKNTINYKSLFDEEVYDCEWLAISNLTSRSYPCSKIQIKKDSKHHTIVSGSVYVTLFLRKENEERKKRCKWKKRKPGLLETWYMDLLVKKSQKISNGGVEI